MAVGALTQPTNDVCAVLPLAMWPALGGGEELTTEAGESVMIYI